MAADAGIAKGLSQGLASLVSIFESRFSRSRPASWQAKEVLNDKKVVFE